MKRPLPAPVQGTSLTDKNGKPTSHNYRWMESIGSSLTDTQTEITNAQTQITNINALLANVTGSAPLFFCRAWVSFDATRNAAGTSIVDLTNRFVRGSGNVANVLRTAIGEYTVTFSTPMPDANYVVLGFSSNNDNNVAESFVVSRQASGTYTATQCAITNTENTSSTTGRNDSNIINVVFIR